jgi:hypothetical protein
MSNSNLNRKVYRVVLRLAELSVQEKIEIARLYVSRMTGNPYFTTPVPALPDVLNDALLLEQAWEGSHDGSHTATRQMYNYEKGLDITLLRLGGYVEGTANLEAAPDVIITSAGMEFKQAGGRSPQIFAVKNGGISGVVNAVTEAVKGKSSYVWEYRLKGDANWTHAAITLKASFQFTGLTEGSVYEFRHRAITKTGTGNWSHEIELRVA